jgi:hypothetical protein
MLIAGTVQARQKRRLEDHAGCHAIKPVRHRANTLQFAAFRAAVALFFRRWRGVFGADAISNCYTNLCMNETYISRKLNPSSNGDNFFSNFDFGQTG